MNQSITQLSLSANLASMRVLGDHVCMWSSRTATTTQPVGSALDSIEFNKPYHQRPKESLL